MTQADETRPGRQQALDLTWPRRDGMSCADFIRSDSNAEALALIGGWREDWPDGRLALCGPEGSGKTHLAMIWAGEAEARFLDLAGFGEKTAREAASAGRLVLEDVPRHLEALAPERRVDAERGLFHLLNLMREQGGRLLLTGQAPPAHWRIGLPDLASRLAATAPARLTPPDDMLLTVLILKLFEDRALRIEPRVADYIAARIDRSFAAAQDAVARLDAYSLETASRITTKTARECFQW